MLFYLLTDSVSEAPDSDDIELRYCGNTILPVFTSPESLSRFMHSYNFEEQGTKFLLERKSDPFALSDMVEYFEERGFEALFFDPPASSGDALWTQERTISLRDYRSSIEEIRPAFERLKPEDAAQFLRASHLRREGFVRWHHPSVEDIAADLRARIDEWLV
jgi:hypothetical protein